MSIFLLALGVMMGGYALYRFLSGASTKQIGTFIVVAGTLTITALIFLLAVTGRLPAVIGAVAALWPLLYSVWKSHQQVKFEENIFENLKKASPQMTPSDALDILGLKPGASEADIDKAYKNLMKKFHPDRKGTEWIARQINVARDVLSRTAQ